MIAVGGCRVCALDPNSAPSGQPVATSPRRGLSTPPRPGAGPTRADAETSGRRSSWVGQLSRGVNARGPRYAHFGGSGPPTRRRTVPQLLDGPMRDGSLDATEIGLPGAPRRPPTVRARDISLRLVATHGREARAWMNGGREGVLHALQHRRAAVCPFVFKRAKEPVRQLPFQRGACAARRRQSGCPDRPGDQAGQCGGLLAVVPATPRAPQRRSSSPSTSRRRSSVGCCGAVPRLRRACRCFH